MIKIRPEVLDGSTCQKRATACYIYDHDWNELAEAANQCSPDGGKCHRMGVVQNRHNYDKESNCNWTHAERMAISKLPAGAKPFRAVLQGHTFYCKDCEECLPAVGVKVFYVFIEDFEKHEYLRTADGDVICEDCGREYRKHPHGYPYDWVRVLCNGTLAHL